MTVKFRTGFFDTTVATTNKSTIQVELVEGIDEFTIGSNELHLIVAQSDGTVLDDITGSIKSGTLNVIQFTLTAVVTASSGDFDCEVQSKDTSSNWDTIGFGKLHVRKSLKER